MKRHPEQSLGLESIATKYLVHYAKTHSIEELETILKNINTKLYGNRKAWRKATINLSGDKYSARQRLEYVDRVFGLEIEKRKRVLGRAGLKKMLEMKEPAAIGGEEGSASGSQPQLQLLAQQPQRSQVVEPARAVREGRGSRVLTQTATSQAPKPEATKLQAPKPQAYKPQAPKSQAPKSQTAEPRTAEPAPTTHGATGSRSRTHTSKPQTSKPQPSKITKSKSRVGTTAAASHKTSNVGTRANPVRSAASKHTKN